MIEIEKPQIECIETPGDASYGKYVIEPLERGYGTTLGNALRRILLSSLPGTAATSIKIAGVQHEFSTIPGVKEDVTEIVLNVKNLLTKLHSDAVKTVFIEAAGPCEVTAGDIKTDGEVEVLNPELHIATLDVGATLSMEITLSHGRGYVSAERNKRTEDPIGIIHVDSLFSPVRRCTMGVTDTRVGQRTDYDKLVLEVETDGSINPTEAVCRAANIVNQYMGAFLSLSNTDEEEGEEAPSIFAPEGQESNAELDKQMERDNARMAELLELMADPDFYINEDASSDAIAEHAQLKKRIAAAEEEWFVLNEELEAEMEKQKAQA